jgi:hypothetical protein
MGPVTTVSSSKFGNKGTMSSRQHHLLDRMERQSVYYHVVEVVKAVHERVY